MSQIQQLINDNSKKAVIEIQKIILKLEYELKYAVFTEEQKKLVRSDIFNLSLMAKALTELHVMEMKQDPELKLK